MRKALGWVLLCGLVIMTACRGGKGEACKEPGDCGGKLTCHEGSCRDPASYCREDAQHAKRCQRDGRCTLVKGRCAPASVAECKESSRCKKHGYCNHAGDCCSRVDYCPHEDEDPVTHLDRLADPARRDAALAKLATLVESAMAQDDNDRKGPHAGPLLDEIAEPLADFSVQQSLPVVSRAKVLRLLAATRHPGTAKALVAAVSAHQLDDKPATPVDGAMSYVLSAIADLGLEQARQPVFRLFKSLQMGWKKASVQGFSSSLGRAVIALADPAWEAELIAMLERPVDPAGDVNPWLDERFRQRTAARVLGTLRAQNAIEPLLRVVLAPQKRDIASAAIDALVHIGKPAATAAADVLAGKHPSLVSYAQKQHAIAKTAETNDVAGRNADAVRVAAAAVVLAHIGRSQSAEAVLAAVEETDDLGKGRIALALPHLPISAELLERYQEITAATPLDLNITARHHGVAALFDGTPDLFDSTLAVWLVDQAIGLQGTDTGLAAFRETALFAAMRLATYEQLPDVDRLAELVTRAKYQKEDAACRQLAMSCKEQVDCYVKAVEEHSSEPKAPFVARKAATMLGVYGKPDHKAKIAGLLAKAQDIELRRILALALARLSPAGDAALAKELASSLDARTTTDTVVSGVVARLRVRAEP